jgi:hypothetical protein
VGVRDIGGGFVLRKIATIDRFGVGDRFEDEFDAGFCRIVVVLGSLSAAGLDQVKAEESSEHWRRVEPIVAMGFMERAQWVQPPAIGPDHHSARTP